jgi:midasin
MDCSWADVQILSNPHLKGGLPLELLAALNSDDPEEYLNVLAAAALQTSCLTRIFAYYEPLFPELAARWISSPDSRFDGLNVVSALARVLPLAEYLKSFTDEYLSAHQHAVHKLLSQTRQLSLLDLDEGRLHQLLLAVFRLLSYDPGTFARHVSPIQLQSLLTHSNRPIRYLAVRIFCIYMHAAYSFLCVFFYIYLGN